MRSMGSITQPHNASPACSPRTAGSTRKPCRDSLGDRVMLCKLHKKSIQGLPSCLPPASGTQQFKSKDKLPSKKDMWVFYRGLI